MIYFEKLLYGLPGKHSDIEMYTKCFGPDLNSCLLDVEAVLLGIRSF